MEFYILFVNIVRLKSIPDAFNWYALLALKNFLASVLKSAPSDQNLRCINFFGISCQ